MDYSRIDSRVPTDHDLEHYSPDGEYEEPPPKPRLKPICFRQLANENPTLAEPVIEGLLRRGETANIIAASKVGKSWLAYGLGLSMITGLDWLEQFPCLKGRVLLIDNELHSANLVNRIKTVAQAMAIQPREYEQKLDVLALRGRLMDLPRLAIELEEIPSGTCVEPSIAPTAAAIADAVLDEALSGHSTAGTVGKALSDLLTQWTTALVEDYSTAGGSITPAQFVHEVTAYLNNFAISGTTRTSKKRDGSTTAMTHTLNDATNPTALSRAS